MRTAACLAALSTALHQHLLLPTYILDPPSPSSSSSSSTLTAAHHLSAALTDLATTSPSRESHLRSVLLAALPPAETDKRASLAASCAAASVVGWLGPLLPSSAEPAFRRALEDFCGGVVRGRWARLQRCETKVEASLEREFDDFEAWEALPLGGEGGGSQQQQQQQQQQQNGGGQRRAGPGLDANDAVAGVVWPAFFIIEDGDHEVLRPGYVLCEAQVKAAREELAVPTLSRRLIRSNTRRSKALSFPAVNGTAGQGGSFLSQGVGVGVGSGPS